MNCRQCGEKMKMGFFATTICNNCKKENQSIQRNARLLEEGKIQAQRNEESRIQKQKERDNYFKNLRKRSGF